MYMCEKYAKFEACLKTHSKAHDDVFDSGQGDVAADDQRGRNTGRPRRVPPHSAGTAVVLRRQSMPSKIAQAQRCELGSVPCDTEVLPLHPLDAGATPNLRRNHDASCDLSDIR